MRDPLLPDILWPPTAASPTVEDPRRHKLESVFGCSSAEIDRATDRVIGLGYDREQAVDLLVDVAALAYQHGEDPTVLIRLFTTEDGVDLPRRSKAVDVLRSAYPRFDAAMVRGAREAAKRAREHAFAADDARRERKRTSAAARFRRLSRW